MDAIFGLNKEAWERWSDYKRQRRKPYKTDFAIERAQKRLASFGEWQMETVEYCMGFEWAGLYPLPKAELAALERAKRNSLKTIRAMAELTERAIRVGFRKPFTAEDEIGYRTLVERAEDQAWKRRRSGAQSVADLLGAKP